MIFRRKNKPEMPSDKEAKIEEANTQMKESERELVTAQRIASHFREIREANHFAEQWRKAIGGQNG